MSDQRPNILFVLSDQQRWDTVACCGEPLFPGLTPNLDRMAAEGVRFEHAFTCQPVCGPARSCLQTGLYATRTGCFTNWRGLPERQRTIAHELAEAGYATAYIGKWHLAGRWDDYPAAGTDRKPVPEERRGGYRDYWLAAEALEFTSHGYEGYMYDGDNRRVDFEGYRPDCLTDFAIDALRLLASGEERPLFMFLSYIEPHQQNDLDRYIGPIGSKEQFREYRVPGDLAGTEGFWRREMPDYLGCCRSLDQNMGRLLCELDALGLADNTLIVYTSDHGNHFGTRNSEAKRSPHDNSIRIPLIVRGPGFRGGRVVRDLVGLIDLPPTLLAAAGVAPATGMDGRPVQDLLGGRNREWPEEVFVQVSEESVGRAIRTRRWKYGVNAPDRDPLEDPAADRYVETWLYDLEQDPHERDNLAADPDHEQVRRELCAKLKDRMVRAGEPASVIEPGAPASRRGSRP